MAAPASPALVLGSKFNSEESAFLSARKITGPSCCSTVGLAGEGDVPSCPDTPSHLWEDRWPCAVSSAPLCPCLGGKGHALGGGMDPGGLGQLLLLSAARPPSAAHSPTCFPQGMAATGHPHGNCCWQNKEQCPARKATCLMHRAKVHLASQSSGRLKLSFIFAAEPCV